MIVKAISTRLRSVCLDESWYDVWEGLDFEGLKKGMEINVLESQPQPGKRNPMIMKWEVTVPEDLDPFKPSGNLYNMLEEKFNTIIEQNTDITNQNKNIIDLQIQIAQHMGIDLNKIKTAGEIKPANNNEVR
jgi:hypothetical protein